MRLTLLFILLFSMLGGSAASASYTTVGSQVSHYPVKQISFSHSIGQAGSLDFDTLTEIFTVDDNIEDDEGKGSLSFRKYKMEANNNPASSYIVTLSRLHGYHSPAASVRSVSSCKYITQRNFRV